MADTRPPGCMFWLAVLLALGTVFSLGRAVLGDDDDAEVAPQFTCEQLRGQRRAIIQRGADPMGVDTQEDIDQIRDINARMDARGCED